MAALDFKKMDKNLYLPPAKPTLIDVPEMVFMAVDGHGAPESAGYQNAVSALYTLAYTIKMSKMGTEQPAGYQDFTVAPLEGLWDEIPGKTPRENWTWTSLMRVPEFVTPAVLLWAREQAALKKPGVDTSIVELRHIAEGLCVQMMHVGPYAEEHRTVAAMDSFALENGCRLDFAGGRRHHELYVTNPQRTAPEKLRTVLRHPVARL